MPAPSTGDPLGDVLELTRATSVMAGGFVAGGRWAVRFPPPGEIKFSLLAKGTCWFRLDGHRKATRAEQGDAVLLPGRDGFIAGSDLSARPTEASALFGWPSRLGTIGDGSDCVILAGGVAVEPGNADLLRHVLPPFLHVRGDAPGAATLRWLIERLLAEQTTHAAPGAYVAAGALAQLVFVEMLRANVSTAPQLPVGWLRAMRDEQLSRALRLLHAEPARDWKLEELARVAAMSRTTFSVRFKQATGVAPLAYLTAWRMRLAQRQLRDGGAPVARIAADLGYASESAFSQAFKRTTGARPRDFRVGAGLVRSRQ